MTSYKNGAILLRTKKNKIINGGVKKLYMNLWFRKIRKKIRKKSRTEYNILLP